MSLLGKILIVLQAILALLFLGVQGTLYHHERDWKQAYDETKEWAEAEVEQRDVKIGVLAATKITLEKDLSQARSSVEAHKTEMKRLETDLRDATKVNTERKDEYDRLLANYETLDSTIKENQARLTQYLDRIRQLEGNLKEATSNQELAEAQVARLLAQRTALEKDLVEIRKDHAASKQKALDLQLALEEIQRIGIPVDTILGNFPPAPPIRGAVAGTDDSVQPGLVLLTVGADDGVKRGFQFTVYRGQRFVGKVVVNRVMADSAGCRVLFTAPGETIQKGDQAATVID